MPTPRIDSIADEGLQLNQFLVEPGCTPLPGVLLAGRYSTRVGLNTVIIGGTPNTLQASEVTLGELFKSQGYATAHAGKWHFGLGAHRAEMTSMPAIYNIEYDPREEDNLIASKAWVFRPYMERAYTSPIWYQP